MRQLILLICLLSIPPASITVATAADADPVASAARARPLTQTQRQFARQLGQRLARDPRYQSIDADWQQFVRSQPRGTDFGALVALVRREAVNAKQRETHLLQRRLNQSSREKAALSRELAHARQLQPTPLQKKKIADLEMRYRNVDDQNQLIQLDLQDILQKQQQTMQMLSNISKVMHDTAMAVVRKIGG